MRTLLVSLLLGAMALPAQDRDFGESVHTTLSELRREPDAYKNVKVAFNVQFASLGKLNNPFFTQFTPSEYANFHAWADEQPIWRQDAYENLFGMLFYDKAGAQLDEIYKLTIYDRLEITGVVRNTFQNQPWIEVTAFKKLPGHVDMAVLTHLYRGEQLMSQRRWQRAIAELNLADGANLTPGASLAAHKDLGICFLRIGEAQSALAHLNAAATLSPTPDFEIERMLATAAAAPSKEIDRNVNQSGLKDHERPIWEAFESDGARLNSVQPMQTPPQPPQR
jgi:tetratricopeptide (TPR) repeat protein